MKDDIYPNLSRADYDAIDAVNQSTLKLFRKTAAHARQAITNPKAPTAAMDLGNAIHCMILEPKRFADSYVIAPQIGNRSKVDKEAWDAFRDNNRGKEIITLDEMTVCKAVKDACYANPVVAELLQGGGKNEVGVVWTDKETGLRCKALLDRVTTFVGGTVIVDLKSCQDASYEEFRRQSAKLGYHEQAAFYLEGLNALAPASRRFFFVAIEKVEPFCVAVYELEDESLKHGRVAFRKHLNMYAQCKATGIWPGYAAGIMPLSIPSWAIETEDANVS